MVVFALIAAGHGAGQIAKELASVRKTVETIDGHIFTIVTTISNLNGVVVDMNNDNFWTANGFISFAT